MSEILERLRLTEYHPLELTDDYQGLVSKEEKLHRTLPSSTTTTIDALSNVDKIAISVLRLMAYFQAGCSLSLCSASVTVIAIKAAVAIARDMISSHHVSSRELRLFKLSVMILLTDVEVELLGRKKLCVSSGSAVSIACPASPLPYNRGIVRGLPACSFVLYVENEGSFAGRSSARGDRPKSCPVVAIALPR